MTDAQQEPGRKPADRTGFEERLPRMGGMTLRVYTVDADGSREEHPDPVPDDWKLPAHYSSTTWPACRCPAHGAAT